MNRRNVRKAYERIALTQGEKDKLLLNILSAASVQAPAERNVTMKRWKNKPVMIAAMIGLMVILMGCAVVALKLSDMKIGERSYTVPAYFDENGEKVPASEITRDMISLQGIAGSDNQKAAQEWLEFEQAYDPNYDLLNDEFDAPEEYDAYFLYTQDMVDKVDEICEKYGLKPAGKMAVIQRWQSEIFFDALGIESLFLEDAEAELTGCAGYFYAGSNFNLDVDFTLTKEDFQWQHEVWSSIRYIDKEYLDTVYCAVTDADNAKQWNYTLADGTNILIVGLENAAMFFCDRDDAFLSVNINTRYEYDDGTIDSMTDRDIEQIAEVIDFHVKPQKPDMEDVEMKLQKSEAEYQAQQEAMMATYVDERIQDSYADYIAILLKGSGNYTYAIADINGDGVEDLLLGDVGLLESYNADTNCFTEVFTIKDGKTCFFFATDLPTYLCEGYVVESCNISEYAKSHLYYTLGSDYDPQVMELEKFECVTYREIDETWRYSDFSDVADTVITEEEAGTIMDSYGRIPLEMKPISEFTKE